MTLVLGKCLYCDTPLEQKPKGRLRMYCDEQCRLAYNGLGELAEEERRERKQTEK